MKLNLSKVQWTNCSTTVIVSSICSEYIEEIIYPISLIPYVFIEKLIKVNHSDYKISEGNFKPYPHIDNNNYAYGLKINLIYSKYIFLDLDDATIQTIEDLVQIFIVNQSVLKIDIIQSSTSMIPNHYKLHMYIELIKPYNVIPLYEKLRQPKYFNAGICGGFLDCALTKKYSVLRVSQKFNNTNPKIDTYPKLLKSYRYLNDKWFEMIPIKQEQTQETNFNFSLRT